MGQHNEDKVVQFCNSHRHTQTVSLKISLLDAEQEKAEISWDSCQRTSEKQEMCELLSTGNRSTE